MQSSVDDIVPCFRAPLTARGTAGKYVANFRVRARLDTVLTMENEGFRDREVPGAGREEAGGAPMPVTAAGGTPRTAILTVDDDPGVSRAVARDLRRRYGEQYRIVRAESGEAALEALREMKLRGDQVAVLLADYRMPQMNGIEFLEQAMDLYSGRPAGAADRLRRHQRRDRRDQRRRRRQLPAQAVGPAGGEALPGDRRAAGGLARRPTTGRCPRPRSSGTAGRRGPRRCASSWPATRCPTAGITTDEPRRPAAGERLACAEVGRPVAEVGDGHRRLAPARS